MSSAYCPRCKRQCNTFLFWLVCTYCEICGTEAEILQEMANEGLVLDSEAV